MLSLFPSFLNNWRLQLLNFWLVYFDPHTKWNIYNKKQYITDNSKEAASIEK